MELLRYYKGKTEYIFLSRGMIRIYKKCLYLLCLVSILVVIIGQISKPVRAQNPQSKSIPPSQLSQQDDTLTTSKEIGQSPIPLVDTWKVQAIRIPKLEKPFSKQNIYLPVKIDCLNIALDPNVPLGYLNSPVEGIATVFWVSCSQGEHNYNNAELELDFKGLDYPGDYSGKIDFLPDDNEKGEVTLTVTVTDFLLLPAFAIFLGIIVAIIIQRRTGVNRSILTLYEDEADTKELKDGTEYRGYKIIDFEKIREEIRENIKKLRNNYHLGAIILSVEDQDYKEIVESLKKLDKNVQRWDAFGYELTVLKEALNLINKAPEFKKNAENLLKGVPLAFEHKKLEKNNHEILQAEELFDIQRENVIKATKLAKSWKGWFNRLTNAKEKLEGEIGELPKIVKIAKFKLAQIEGILMKIYDLDELEAQRTEQLLSIAEKLIYGIMYFEDQRNQRGVKNLKSNTTTLDIDIDLASQDQTIIPYPIPDKFPTDDEQRLRFVQRTLYRSDLLMFILALIGGVYTGLISLYVGKTFGTLWDYINAFAWGFGTKTTLEVVYAALNKLVRVVD